MWLIFSLSSTLFYSITSVLLKVVLQQAKIGVYTLTWVITFFSSLLLLPFLYIYGLPEINPQFWLFLVLHGFFDTASYITYFSALKNTDLSLVAPLTSLTPLFLLFTSPLLTFIFSENSSKEIPNLLGILGIISLTTGTYIINLKKKKGVLYPIKFIFTDNGAIMALLTAFLWSIKNPLAKLLLIQLTSDNSFQRSSFFCFSFFLTLSCLILPLMIGEFFRTYKGLKLKTTEKQSKSLELHLNKYRKNSKKKCLRVTNKLFTRVITI